MSETNINKGRNSSISLLRFLSMLLIIGCHFFQFYDNELARWFNVGVQIFFCISGFLYGTKKIEDPIGFVSKNFKKILIPYFSFLIPCILLYFIFAPESISVLSAIKAVLCSGVIDGIGHLWFISYILFCYIITPVLYEIVGKIKGLKCFKACVTLLAVIFLGQLIFSAFDSYFTFSKISCYIIGYFLAFMLNEYGKDIFKRIAYVFFAGAVVSNVFRIIVKYFLSATFTGFPFVEHYAHVLLGISIFMIIYLYSGNLKYNRLLKISDKYAYYVYIVHQLFVLSPFSLMTLTNIVYLNWALVLIGIAVLTVLLKFVSDKVEILVDKI